MSLFDTFWKEIREEREFRKTLEGAVQKQEWESALRKYASVVVFGGHTVCKPLQEILKIVTQTITSIDLTALPQNREVLEGAISGAFNEWGKFLLLGLGANRSPRDKTKTIEKYAFEKACEQSSSYAVCFATMADLLTYVRDLPSEYSDSEIVRHASLVIVNEEEPPQVEIERISSIVFPKTRLIFFTDNAQIVADKVVSGALELFEAATTL